MISKEFAISGDTVNLTRRLDEYVALEEMYDYKGVFADLEQAFFKPIIKLIVKKDLQGKYFLFYTSSSVGVNQYKSGYVAQVEIQDEAKANVLVFMKPYIFWGYRLILLCFFITFFWLLYKGEPWCIMVGIFILLALRRLPVTRKRFKKHMIELLNDMMTTPVRGVKPFIIKRENEKSAKNAQMTRL